LALAKKKKVQGKKSGAGKSKGTGKKRRENRKAGGTQGGNRRMQIGIQKKTRWYIN